MSNQNANKPGYKHTPLGWIPEDWEIKPIGKIYDRIVVAFVGEISSSYCNKEVGIPFIRTLNVKDGFFDVSELVFVSNDFHIKNKKSQIANDDILIARVGANMGNTCKVSNLNTEANAANVIIIKGKSGVNSDFYTYFLSSNLGQKQIQIKSGGGAQSVFNTTLAIQTLAPVPSRKEVDIITNILSTWDEAISKTQQLITQLQQRNKGLMQQLLTGRKRLKGFGGEWKKLHISEIAKEVILKNKTGLDLTVLSCTKYNGLVPSLEYFGRRVFGSDISAYKLVPINHFAYATNHIEEGSIGLQNRFEQALISPMYTVFKTDDHVYNEFLFRVLKSHNLIHEYCKRMEGSIDRRGGLRWDEFSKIIIYLPKIEEQKAIASFLKIADDEVQLYEKKLFTLQQQKKGLMQKLLTGEIRVKVETSDN